MKFLKFLGVFMLLFVLFVPTVHAQTNIADAAVCATGEMLKVMDQKTCESMVGMFKDKPDGPWYNQNFSQFAKKVTDKNNPDAIFGERYTFAQINWIINSIATMLNPAANIQNIGDLKDFMLNVKGMLDKGKIGQVPSFQDYAKLGPAGLFAGGMTALYSNPPASAVSETKYMASRIFDFGTGTTPVYAAEGYGYAGLSSGGAVRALWTASRNMSYLMIVIILIASGFMIMFRVKINPQTVVSLQTMIPKLVTTLILITFSFAIAGLVIDMIYVIIVATVGIIATTGGTITGNVSDLIKTLTVSGFVPTYVWIQALVPVVFIGLISLILILIPGIVPTIIGAILAVVVFVFYLIILWKIFWMLLKAYVTLLLQISIGPLQIMLDLIPGQSGFGPWIRNVIAEASVFAVVPIMLLIQNILSWNPINKWFLGLNDYGSFEGPSLPFLGKETGVIIPVAVGFVILSITPKIADIIKEMLKVPAFKHGNALGESFNTAKTLGQGEIARRVGDYEQAYGGPSVGGSVLRTLGVIKK